jgi:hypothetical protein
MTDGHAAFACDPGRKNTTIEVFVQRLGRPALLPRDPASTEMPRNRASKGHDLIEGAMV